MVRRLSLSWLPAVIRRPGFWLILVVLVLITIPHYYEAIQHPAFLAQILENLGLDQHAFERILYLIPIFLAGFLFGQRGAIVVSLVALACMLPRAILISEHATDAVVETVGVFVVGAVVALSFGSLRKERERRIQFSVLNEISGVVSQSLELGQVLSSSIDSVINVMKVDAAMVFLLNKEAGELTVAAQRGLSPGFVQSISRIKLGQGFNGRVTETGEPLIVEDVSQDPSVTKAAVVAEGIEAQLIVPLKSKGKVVGTLCAAVHSSRRFRQDEVELLTAIGNQIGVAVENARLYEQEKEVTNQIRESEERLTRLNTISTVLAESLELEQVLHKAIDMVMKIMEVDVGLIFSLDEGSQELVLMAYEGVSKKFAESVDRTKVGEGFNGKVARTGEPLIVKNVTTDTASYVPQIKEMKIESEVIVPMSFGGDVVGTIWIAQRRPRDFLAEDVSLLTALGSQIGNSIANARLYQEQREVTEQLRVSEERYRELFENANDAIWVHDLEGNIIAANKASEKLTGYTVEELLQTNKLNVSAFLSDEGLIMAKDIRRRLLKNEPVVQPYEQRILRKDGTEAILMITTNLVTEAGRPVAFQHIARDVTEEKRMRENLQFYLRQINRAQEEERKRIARELHDDTIQYMVVLARQLDELASSSKGLSDEERLRLENLRQQINSIMEGVRRLSHDLRPATLDRLGLVPALEWLASQVPSEISVDVKAFGIERRLPAEVELVLFRIAQEALSNVRRHSQATKAEVKVEFEDKKTRITVSDNGKGFALPETMGDLVKAGRLGLAGMQERIQLLNGSLKVESEPGSGTTVTVEAPI